MREVTVKKTNPETNNELSWTETCLDLYDAEIAACKIMGIPHIDLKLYYENSCWIQEIDGYKISISFRA